MFNIDLFPLGTVLFPESELPLHIFEEKYKRLINKCEKENREFGVNAISSSKMYDVGCTAKLTNILQKYEDGRMDIIVKGEKKFNLVNFEEGGDHYLVGQVEYIDDDTNEKINIQLLSNCLKIYNDMADMVKTIDIKKINIKDMETNLPSYMLAQKAGLTLLEKQKLLEMNNENRRLEFLNSHLKAVLPLLQEAEYVNKIIKNDGYYKN